jgi:hypothetical protein
MSSIQEVQVAEKRVQTVLRELKNTDLASRDDLHQQLAEVTDEYVKAVSDLKVKPVDAKHRKRAYGRRRPELFRWLLLWRSLALYGASAGEA